MFKKLIISVFVITTIMIAMPILSIEAQTSSIIDNTDSKYEEGDYGLDDFVILAIRVSRWILGIVGSLTLIMFIYGGITFLTSAGGSEAIGRAKKIIVAAIIGLIIVFTSWLIIRFVMQSMGLSWEGKIEKPSVNPEQTMTK